MTGRALSFRRKSKLFLNNLAPVTNNYDELVRAKLKGGKFPITKTGIIKMIGLVMLLAGLAFFLGHPTCTDTSSWYPYLYPISLGIHFGVQLVLFIIFSFGWTTKSPWRWIKTDISLNFILSILTIISSTLTNIDCSATDTLDKIPGPVGIVAGAVLIISCAGLFLLFRYKEEEEMEGTAKPAVDNTPRKSVFA